MTGTLFAQYLMSAAGLSLVAGTPLLVLAVCSVPFLRGVGFRLLPWSTVPAVMTALLVPPGVEVKVPWFFMGSTMGLDGTARIFLGLTAWVWLLASLSVCEKFSNDPHRFRFAGFFLASMSGNFGLILARDILGFYLFFALMSFSAYGLIIHDRTEQARKAGRVYLMLVFLSELAMFTGLVLLSGRGEVPAISDITGGDIGLLLTVILFIAFGVKVGALPFHSWMVVSYQQAPIPAATALAGAMVNAGILGWLRFFPLGHLVLPAGGWLFIVLGAAAALYGVFFGLYQMKPGRVLASSSISQMGLVTVITGLGLLSGETGGAALTLMTLFAVHHSLAKTSLFLGYDLVDRGGRLAWIVLVVGLLIPSLALSGLPLTSGAMIKGGIKELAGLAGHSWHMFGSVFLPVSSIGTTILMLHCVRLLRLRAVSSSAGGKRLAAALWALSVAAVAAVPWLWPPLQKLAGHSLQASAVLQSLWPVALGVGLAILWFATGSRLPGRDLDVADFDQLVRTGYAQLMRLLTGVTDVFARAGYHFQPEQLRQRFPLLFSRSRGPGKWEKMLRRWGVVGLCYLLICILLFLIMLSGEIPAGGA